jgi:hypothetical protein
MPRGHGSISRMKRIWEGWREPANCIRLRTGGSTFASGQSFCSRPFSRFCGRGYFCASGGASAWASAPSAGTTCANRRSGVRSVGLHRLRLRPFRRRIDYAPPRVILLTAPAGRYSVPQCTPRAAGGLFETLAPRDFFPRARHNAKIWSWTVCTTWIASRG